MTTQQAEEPDRDEGTSPFQFALGCAAGLAWVAIPALLYLGLLFITGLFHHPDLGRGPLVAGSVLATVVALAVSMMGESLIEDFVKVALFAAATASLWYTHGTVVGAVALGAGVGASMPLLTRVVSRWTSSD